MAEAASARPHPVRVPSSSRAVRGQKSASRARDALSQLQRLADASPRVTQLLRLQTLANGAAVTPPMIGPDTALAKRTERPDAPRADTGTLFGLVSVQQQARVHDKEIPADVSPAGIQRKDDSASVISKTHSVVQKIKRKLKKKAVLKRNGLKKVAFKKRLPAKRQVMTVRNRFDVYDSGIIRNLTPSSGVNPGPRREAQKVADFLGGSWVGGHMVNDQLGGVGDFSNIVPITSSMNGRHKTIENRANNELSGNRGTAVRYKMNIYKRETRVNGLKTVHNLPVEFKQTLEIHPKGRHAYTVNGNVLKHP